MRVIIKLLGVIVVFGLVLWGGLQLLEAERGRQEGAARSFWSDLRGTSPAPSSVPEKLPSAAGEPAPVKAEPVQPEVGTVMPAPVTEAAVVTPAPPVESSVPTPAAAFVAAVVEPTPAPAVVQPAVEVAKAVVSEVTVTPTPTPVESIPAVAPILPTPASTDHGSLKKAVAMEPAVIILGYHRFGGPGSKTSNIYTINIDLFESQMNFLKVNGYTVVSLSDLYRFLKGEIGLPQKSVVITIDDGYQSVYQYAYPVLKQYGYPWTFFVYPDFVSNGGAAIKWEELKIMQKDGVDIQSHTKSHPLLTQKGGRTNEQYDAWLQAELAGSKETIEKKLGNSVEYLAYPYGDWNKYVQEKALAAGYKGLLSTSANSVGKSTPPDNMGRFIITKDNQNLFSSYLQQLLLNLGEQVPAPGGTTDNSRPEISAILSYGGKIDPKSVEAEVSGFGKVNVDFDSETQKARIRLPRDLVQRQVRVTFKIKDADTGLTRQESWHFYYLKGK